MSYQQWTCLNELQSVIEKYDLTRKFGVALLHKHFEIGEDEVLLETNDPVNRSLNSEPVKINEAEKKGYATTIWRFDGALWLFLLQ
jgi:hypothetical protein